MERDDERVRNQISKIIKIVLKREKKEIRTKCGNETINYAECSNTLNSYLVIYSRSVEVYRREN